MSGFSGLWTDSNRHTVCGEFQKAYQFKIYLQSHRCNGILDRFGLEKTLEMFTKLWYNNKNQTQGGEYAEPRQAKDRWLYKKSKYAFERNASQYTVEDFMCYCTIGNLDGGSVGHYVNQSSA
jgi:hypothetical protein